MHAVIDVGSNTIRMLIGESSNGIILPHSYHRQITRLAGGFSEQLGLAEAGLSKSLSTLKLYKKIIFSHNVSSIRVVGTAALRRAHNRDVFIDKVLAETGLTIEVIDGVEEARLTTMGALSAINPLPESAIIIDIGGGSTELVGFAAGAIRFQNSYPLGVVNLSEEWSSKTERQQQINATFEHLTESLESTGLSNNRTSLIGTAGTITTLAAIHLQLLEYAAEKINNHELSACWLNKLQQKLELMSVPEREALVGMEQGRGDLIVPGVQILLTLMEQLHLSSLRVADSGLLEGVFMSLTDQ